MTGSIDSNYDCANASSDLPQLMEQLRQLENTDDRQADWQEQMNHLENQIRFIQNKCDIPKGS
ncbi:DUF2524 domain-containing protein [Paenibacillus sp. LHD-117]|uniref:DUF2524 domain-containing protein n=1 Tax=Paenibacillus sp. LHD-117 TaxID=3071412 RepID=UPI0027E04F71|nr:DUF2524 domain-containing protein [Paenibacillus sp. LHD-117]MDQ6420891.1 DUF2524 domain-containing protein [Paenibacillus sp. LHD-117]